MGQLIVREDGTYPELWEKSIVMGDTYNDDREIEVLIAFIQEDDDTDEYVVVETNKHFDRHVEEVLDRCPESLTLPMPLFQAGEYIRDLMQDIA